MPFAWEDAEGRCYNEGDIPYEPEEYPTCDICGFVDKEGMVCMERDLEGELICEDCRDDGMGVWPCPECEGNKRVVFGDREFTCTECEGTGVEGGEQDKPWY